MAPWCKVVATIILTIFTDLAAAPSSAQELDQIMPQAKLDEIRNSLPRIAFEGLNEVLWSPQTLWYDHDVMTPTYQDSVGANTNETWPDLVAASEQIIGGFFDREHRRWQFPFGTTAGTDNSTNIYVANFVHLPFEGSRVKPIDIRIVIRNASRPQWDWTYHEGTIFGEIIFLRDGGNILPLEIRTRRKYPRGWGMNIFRPFPRASWLAMSIKSLRPSYQNVPSLRNLVNHLENENNLVAKSLRARSPLTETFAQDGWIDDLPPFGDDDLVRMLLTTVPFVSTYGTAWKRTEDGVTYGASTRDDFSIVPNHYDAGLLEVTDETCMRCHKEGGRLVSEFTFDLFLYGEIWGKDGIFSFHPFDESQYPYLRQSGNGPGGMVDNRKINPVLARMGLFRMADAVQDRENWVDPAVNKDESDAVPVGFEVNYQQHVKPILDANCTECHSGHARKTDLSRFPFPRTSGMSQELIVEIMLRKVSGTEPSMPPGNRPRLSARDMATLNQWKEGGLQP